MLRIAPWLLNKRSLSPVLLRLLSLISVYPRSRWSFILSSLYASSFILRLLLSLILNSVCLFGGWRTCWTDCGAFSAAWHMYLDMLHVKTTKLWTFRFYVHELDPLTFSNFTWWSKQKRLQGSDSGRFSAMKAGLTDVKHRGRRVLHFNSFIIVIVLYPAIAWDDQRWFVSVTLPCCCWIIMFTALHCKKLTRLV